MRPSSGDTTKLPKWAQQRIKTLERDLEYWKNKVRAGPENSVVFANPYSDAPRPLGDDTIEFVLGEKKIRVRVERDHHDGWYLDVNGGTIISVSPRASNSIEIRVIQ